LTPEGVQERRRSKAAAIDPNLALLRENRDRAVRHIFLDHLQRKRDIFGFLDKEEEEEAAHMFHTKFCDKKEKAIPAQEQSKEQSAKLPAAHMNSHTNMNLRTHSQTREVNEAANSDKEIASFTVMVIHAQNLPPPALLPQGGG